jgi:drug/metabolite transporter (DMT)-like permease
LERQQCNVSQNALMSPLRSAAPALAAALLFGASTPLAKILAGDVSPVLLAGLLYLGSGTGLALAMLVRRAAQGNPRTGLPALRIPGPERLWLLGAIVTGGVLGPALLMSGLQTTDGATASLLLNVEGVLTAVLAWLVFRENADRRVVAGMAAIVLGGALLSWQPGPATLSTGALLIIAACACWAVDNNLTRKVSTNDAMLIACLKGLVAGVFNTTMAVASGSVLPAAGTIAAAMAVGFAGYGLSLVLFVVALRTLGTARTGAYFSVAPLFGVVISLLLWPALPGLMFWLAALLMAAGVWLHVRERHAHPHVHEPLTHAHAHHHDEHHLHTHPDGWDGEESHSHVHTHDALEHTHVHYPDVHHRHRHSS